MTLIQYNKYNTDFSYMLWRVEEEKWGVGRNRYRRREGEGANVTQTNKKGMKKQEEEIKRWEREEKENK